MVFKRLLAVSIWLIFCNDGYAQGECLFRRSINVDLYETENKSVVE